MKTSLFDYILPEEKIAKFPPKERGGAKLLIYDRQKKNIKDGIYRDFLKYIKKGDVIVLNNTKVDKRRLYFISENGKSHELLILAEQGNKPESNDKNKIGTKLFEAIIGRSADLKEGDRLLLMKDKSIEVELIRKEQESAIWLIAFMNGDPFEIFEKYGETPLPPYLHRQETTDDYKRYNTVFSKVSGSSASPTASLNITDEILRDIEVIGAKIVYVTLEVGWGTFAPIRTENIEEHKIHVERFILSKESATVINDANQRGGSLWTFGTTSTRVIESCINKEGLLEAQEGSTSLYITPGYKWKMVDHLVTNFHAPRTSLLTLVGSFMGVDEMLMAYEHALNSDYHFLSYGDSMLIL